MATNHQQKQFVPPTRRQRAEALGEIDTLDKDIRSALTIGIKDSFLPIPIPTEDDWLSSNHESGQTVEQFERCRKTIPRPTRNIIYIQPIGSFDGPRSPNLDIISEFSQIFFPGCQTEILSTIEFDMKMKKRINQYTNQTQYMTGNLTDHLKKMQRKRHNRRELFCIGATMVDIYPGPRWNFVYGEASVEEGIGIYSFARFDPLFPHDSPETLQKPCTQEEQVLILKRAVSTYLHEVMHLFGIEHCIYYLCLMNGTNCESEMDGQLVYLCPVCLKKMYLLFGKQNYHVMDVYKGLLDLMKKVGFEEERKWYENRLRIINENL